MDNIPAAALHILANIRRIETGSEGTLAYDTIYGHNQKKLSKPLTKMTLAEVITAGPSWTRQFKSSAAGAYQFMNATLKGLAVEYKLDGEVPFDMAFQDWLGYLLLRRRGVEDFLAGRLSVTAFGKLLAQEWASWPVLAATKGAHRNVQRGETYYAGDRLNKALVPATEVERILAEALRIHHQKSAPVPQPRPVKQSWWQWFKGLFS